MEGAQHTAATGDDELAEAGAEEDQGDGRGGCEIGLVEGHDEQSRGGERAEDEPGAAEDPEVGDGAPEEVDDLGKIEKGDDAGAAGGADTLLAEEIGEDAGDDSVGEDGHGSDKEGEGPGAFRCVWGWGFVVC